MVDHSTEITDPTGAGGVAHAVPQAASLVVAWSATRAPAVGEALRVPIARGAEVCLGRGAASPDDPSPRAEWVRQRPGEALRVEAAFGPRISRRQLVLRAAPDGSVEVKNVGRCRLLLDGVPATEGRLHPGGTLALRDELLLYLPHIPPAATPSPAQALPPDAKDARFGQADADGIVGESAVAWALRQQIAFLAGRAGHVLILGPSGTGKELVAQALHRRSPRGDRPLIARNAATVPAGIIDAELFGNCKDYPQSGMPARPGLFGAAHGSTLFLDEIGDLPADLQTHLLRVLDGRGEYQRLGEARTQTSDFRLIGATNRSLADLKPDFAARLPLRLSIAGLNERRADIPLLIRHVLVMAAAKDAELGARFFASADGATPEPRVSMDLVRALLLHTYRLHVRELETLLWTSIASSPGHELALTEEVAAELAPAEAEPAPQALPPPTLEAIEAALQRHNGVQERVWRELGLPNRYVLKRLIKKHGLRG